MESHSGTEGRKHLKSSLLFELTLALVGNHLRGSCRGKFIHFLMENCFELELCLCMAVPTTSRACIYRCLPLVLKTSWAPILLSTSLDLGCSLGKICFLAGFY